MSKGGRLSSLVSIVLVIITTGTVACFTSPTTFLHHSQRLVNHPKSQVLLAESSVKKREYAALEPGTTVKIKVGNVQLGRKAWKKRRRSGSPLLVPCSVLNMDRQSMVRWNILYLIEKFGAPIQDQEIGFTGKGVTLSYSQVGSFYKSHLGTSLNKHAQALGYETSQDLFGALFPRKVQKEFGLRVWKQPSTNGESQGETWLVIPISRHRARDLASQAGIVQFCSSLDQSQNDETEETMKQDNENPDKEEDFLATSMKHTGMIRVKQPKSKNKKQSYYKHLPLSAAIRVSQRDVDEGRIENGSIHDAVVFSYDATGDGGSPLLIMTLNKNSNIIQHGLKKLRSVREQCSGMSTGGAPISRTESAKLKHNLQQLKVGEGPYKAKVMRVSTNSGAVFVDANVGRMQGKQRGGGMTRVLGMLRFDDLVKVPKQPTISDKQTSSRHDEEMNLLEEATTLDEEEEEWDDATSIEDLFQIPNDEDKDENLPEMVVDNGDDDDTTAAELRELVAEFREELSDSEADFLEMAIASSEQEKKEPKEDTETVSAMEEEEEEGEEIVEDITDFFSMNEEGLTYQDPETGETILVEGANVNMDGEDETEDFDETEEEEDDDDSEFQAFSGMTAEERLDAIAKLMIDEDEDEDDAVQTAEFEADDDINAEEEPPRDEQQTNDWYSVKEPLYVKVGDTIDVYIKYVSKQSGRYMVTTDPSIKGQKPKDLKQQAEADKKLSKLASTGNLKRILQSKGKECNGIVKATSNTGDWFYVQPELDDMPVGVATAQQETLADEIAKSISQGDVVRVRLDGIDKSRGQLAMTVLEKLSPR